MFKLMNANEKWTETSLIETDTSSYDIKQAKIVLTVNWVEKESWIEVNEDDFDSVRLHNRLDQEYNLPYDLDASMIEKYYNEKIKPLLIEQGKQFEVTWDGCNSVGSFKYDEYDEQIAKTSIEELCRYAPTHDIFVFFSLDAMYTDDNDLIKEFDQLGIDFLNIDITDDIAIKFENDLAEYYMVFDVKKELTERQTYLKQNME